MTKTVPTPSPLEPATRAFVDGLPDGPPIYTLAPVDARAVLSSVQQSVLPPAPAVDSEDRTLALGPTGSTDIRIIRPAGRAETLPPHADHAIGDHAQKAAAEERADRHQVEPQLGGVVTLGL
ncbi:hypothetical protein, partial [Sphingopyxis sp.]|uniref:hypothetical protein n=1 Tax=Sphingopyxis sp. TaxID=1908224 RepID=UPI002EDA6114